MTTTTIIADEIPCEVLLPDGTLVRRARAVMTDEGVTVYTEPRPGDQPVLAFRARYTTVPTDLPNPHAPRRRRVYRLQTGAGAVLVNVVAGCLCVYPSLRAHTPDTLRDAVRAGLITTAV